MNIHPFSPRGLPPAPDPANARTDPVPVRHVSSSGQVWLLAAVLLGLWALVPSVRAETFSMAMALDMKVHQSRATFEPSRQHPDEDWLYLTRAHDDVETAMRVSMSGQKDMTQKGRATVSEVPGVTEGVSGYKRAKIETFGREATLVIETKLTRKKKKDNQEVEEKEERVDRIPLQFANPSDTVDDLRSGRTLELRISKAGLQALLQSGKDKAVANLNVNADGQGAKMSASASAGLLHSSRKGAVFVSKDRLDYEAPPIWVRSRASIKLKTTD